MSARYNTDDLSLFFDQGVKKGATHMFIMHQRTGQTGTVFDYNDQHCYVMPGEDVGAKIATQHGECLELYNLRLEKEPQLKQYRVFNL